MRSISAAFNVCMLLITGDAAKIVARVRCAVDFLMQSIARQTAHKVRLEERRQRLAQR